MGNKRHCEEDEARISKKIRRLERKLRRKRRMISSDSSDAENEEQVPVELSSPPRLSSPQDQVVELDIARPISPNRSIQNVVVPSLSISGPSSAPEQTISLELEGETGLEEDILQILGEAPQPDIVLGKDIHKDIASRWQHILVKGLLKDVKESLLKKYMVPSNCSYLVAPILNPEAKAALPDILIKRDFTIMQKQNQLGFALGALSQLTEMIIRGETSKHVLLQPLSDACRILCDNHYIETKSRRSIIGSSTNTSLREALYNTSRDKYLFGEELSERLKTAKSVQKTSESLIKMTQITPRPNSGFKNILKKPVFKLQGPQSKKAAHQEQRVIARTPCIAAKSQSTSAAACTESTVASQEESQIDQQVRSQSPSDAVTSCREIIRQALLSRFLSPRSVEIMLSSLSNNTYKQYNGCVKTWISYCHQHSYDYTSSSIPIVIHFLTEIFDKGAKYGTINSYKSALSLLLGNNLDDERLKRFMKGVFKSRPTNPKYNITWDPDMVLKYLAQQWPNESLDLKTLSKKTVTLLALVTAHRVQTLSLTKIDNIHTSPDEIIIRIPDPIKTTRLNTVQPLLRLPFYNTRPEICPARCLQTYLQKTMPLRCDNTGNLFLSFKKPYNNISSQTISHWLKDTLEASGIDTSIFSAHSTRHAATSKANKLGVSIEVIKKTAGWSDSSSIFARFYNKEIVNHGDFARSLLDSSL